MLQPSKKDNNRKAIAKLKIVLEQCRNVKVELNSIKNLTFKTKRNMINDIRFVRDSLKQSLKKNTNIATKTIKTQNSEKQSTINTATPQVFTSKRSTSMISDENKQNNYKRSNLTEKFDKIEVGLSKENMVKEKPILMTKRKDDKKKDIPLNSKILLELQELKLLEQRGSLISKRNERINNYYSETRKQKGDSLESNVKT